MSKIIPSSMRRSLFWLLDYHPTLENSAAELMSNAVSHCQYAESIGFQAAWCAEHHFHLSIAPNPAIFLTAVSQRTETLRIGPAISVLPLRNPIQVAEDYAMLDVLSGGRLNMGVGTGSQPLEAQGMGTDYENRFVEFEVRLDEVIRRWKRAANNHFDTEAINIAPVQKPLPPLYETTNQPKRAYEIGLSGRSLLTIASPGTEDLQQIQECISAHRSGLIKGGYGTDAAESIVVAFSHVNENEDKAREVASSALGNLLSSHTGEATDATAIYQTMQTRKVGVFGSPEQVADILLSYAEIGVEHMAFLNRFGAMDWKAAKQSLSYLK